ncbi:hypothetical protein F5Y17DRAFT_465942 [Xylariaceae sp. FL0594]|nr:hypothetical protein F5Y17DRAFT_465942 [Xylariaceae sp. FL0594]
MPLELRKVEQGDFPALIEALYESYSHPPQSILDIFFKPREVAQAERLKEAADRFANWDDVNPSSFWQKVVDTESGKIFAGEFLRQYSVPRAEKGREGQVFLYIIFTVPAYRRKGVAQKFMSWGMSKADELGVEMFFGRKYSWDATNLIAPKADTPELTTREGWKKMEGLVRPVTLRLMWRPVNGKYDEGQDKAA